MLKKLASCQCRTTKVACNADNILKLPRRKVCSSNGQFTWYDCRVRQKKCRSTLKRVLQRYDNRKSCRTDNLDPGALLLTEGEKSSGPTRSLPQMKDYPSLSLCLKWSIILHFDHSVRGLVVANKKKKLKAAPGQDLNPEHPLRRNCFYPLNH